MKFSNGNSSAKSRLYSGSAIAALALIPLAASAQPTNLAAETVTVTGTIIRGAGPTGSNLITFDRSQIEATGATTIGQVLADIPGLNNFGSAGQGAQNSADPGGASSPTIHSLGSSASNGTLVLIDNHRLPYTGIQHNTIDPSAVPVIALQRVEVLPDGASSTYGSDAVAGVLNFITRKNFTGVEFTTQYGMADHYESFSAGALFGQDWQSGSAMLAYEYVSKSQFSNGWRSYQTARQDIRLGAMSGPCDFAASLCTNGTPNAFAANTPTATNFLATTPDNTHGTTGPFNAVVPASPSRGSNFQNFACPTATISATSGSASFLYPYNSNVSITNAGVNPSNGVCDETSYGSWLPSETRNTVFMSFKQRIGDSIALTADFDYSTRFEGQINTKGATNANPLGSPITVFGPTSGRGTPTAFSPTTGLATATLTTGGQINPFYNVGSTGLSTASTRIQYDFTPLLIGAGLPATLEKTGDTVAFADLGLTWDMGNDWELDLGGTFGVDYDFDRTTHSLCVACAYLALNGTTNFQGNPNVSVATSAIPDPVGLGTILAESRSLTTANALDVWDPPGATNKTSMTVLQQLNSGYSNTTATQGIQDFNIILHGAPFALPAGAVKFALGGEFMHTTDQQLQNTASTALGPQSVASPTVNLFYGRTVWSGFMEILVPLVSPDMNVPLVQKLDLDFSGRVDQYTTYGGTKNPKVGFTWDITDGLRGRGSFGTSFTVPAFASGGQSKTGITSQSATSTGGTPALAIAFNDQTYNGGAGVAGTWVGSAATCAAAGSTPVDANNAAQAAPYTNAVACLVNSNNNPGIQYAAGGKPGLRPEIGMTYSAGFDFDIGKYMPLFEGLTGEVTYYQAKYSGLVTSIGLATAQPGLTYFAPVGGWTQSSPFVANVLSTGYPLTSTLPSTIWTFFDGRQTNAYTLWQNGLDYGIHYVFNTDMGTFHAGINGNEILRFTQRNEGPSNPLIDIKNGKAGSSGRFAGQEMTWRATAGWNQGPYQLQVSFNFQSPYFASVTAFPYNRVTSFDPAPQAGVTAGNLQKIAPLKTFDLTAGYVIPGGWYQALEGTQLTLSVTNLFDTDPPFQDNANGFGPGSQLGRLVTLSLKKSF